MKLNPKQIRTDIKREVTENVSQHFRDAVYIPLALQIEPQTTTVVRDQIIKGMRLRINRNLKANVLTTIFDKVGQGTDPT